MNTLFRPRRRPLLRFALVVTAGLVLLAAGLTVIWLRTHIVPPDCEDAATLAEVSRNLTNQFGLPPHITFAHIRTRAGGYLAFRFTCEADLRGIDSADLPSGTPIPGTVYYISRLTGEERRHEVSVSIHPLLILERVQ